MEGAPQVAALPEDVRRALAARPAARRAWDSYPPSHRREWLEHVLEAKQDATRLRRIGKMIEQLEKAPVRSSERAGARKP